VYDYDDGYLRHIQSMIVNRVGSIMNRAIALGLLLLFATASSAAEDGLALTIGRLSTNEAAASQVISVENKTSRNFSRIHVECGFYAGNNLVGSGGASLHDLQAGTIGHDDVVALNAGDTDNVKCRIESAK
jgi:hypothetical protein